jgi:hypothetical protein
MPHDSEQHAQHDPLLVVSLADGDLTGADRDLASGLIAECTACATLHDDLLAIARATAALPTAVRPRDFQLSPEQAARLRPLGWRRFVAAFASPRLAMTRQLGIGLTTLGIAGLLVSVLPTVNLGTGSAAGASMAPPNVQSATDGSFLSGAESLASAAAASAPAAASALPAPADASASYDTSLAPLKSDLPDRTSASDGGGTVGVAGQGSEGPKASPAGDAAERQLAGLTAEDPSGMPLILVASTILLAAGIALLVARRIARGLTGN